MENKRSQIAVDAVNEAQLRIAQWAEVFSLCADPTRIKILFVIHAAPESSVNELAQAAELSPNTVTQALATLQRAQVIEATPDGRFRRWRLMHAGVHQLLHQMEAPHSELHPEHPVSEPGRTALD